MVLPESWSSRQLRWGRRRWEERGLSAQTKRVCTHLAVASAIHQLAASAFRPLWPCMSAWRGISIPCRAHCQSSVTTSSSQSLPPAWHVHLVEVSAT